MAQSVVLSSWNVQHPGRERLDEVLAAIQAQGAEILTLQEANQAVVDGVRKLGYRHQVFGRDGTHPSGTRDHVPKHGALIASRFEVVPDVGWTRDASYPALFARATVRAPLGEIDVITAHIPNGSSNGWRKVQHCQVLGRCLRDASPGLRVLTGDFNEPQRVLPDGRVVSHAATIREPGSLNLEGEVNKGTEGIAGPHSWREWDRAVCDLFNPGFHGLTHALLRKTGSMRPMPVTHRTRSHPRFFDHAFVSAGLQVVKLEYLHELRHRGVSDHSALRLVLACGATPGADDWAE